MKQRIMNNVGVLADTFDSSQFYHDEQCHV